MKVNFFFAFAFLITANADTGGPGSPTVVRQVSLKVPDETAPPGGLAQMKFFLTEPTPISSGGPRFSYDANMFDGVWGIQVFNPTGDVNGVALMNGSSVNMSYTTSTGSNGSDYPMMTVALHVRPDALPGSKTQFSLDPSSTWILGLLGPTTLKPAPPATVTVGGSISITNILPGGGVVPPGTVVSIRGIGFQRRTQVQLSAIKASSIVVVSSNEIQFTVAESTDLTAKQIQVVNPDGSQDTYFSYMRGIPFMTSNRPLLAGAVPIFSSVTHSTATFASMGTLSSTQFSGVALQNPQLSASTVTVSLYSYLNQLLGSSTFQVAPGYRLIAETSELVNAAPPPGSYVVVTATQPVQTFGFIADSAQSTVLPFAAQP